MALISKCRCGATVCHSASEWPVCDECSGRNAAKKAEADRWAALTVEQKHLRRPLGSKLIRHLVTAILKNGIGNFVLMYEGGDFCKRVLRVGQDGHDGHALLGIVVRDRLQSPGVEFGQRALRSEKGHDHKIMVREIGKSVFLARMIWQAKTGGFVRGNGCRRAGSGKGQKENRQQSDGTRSHIEAA